jgi:hypothetical protein
VVKDGPEPAPSLAVVDKPRWDASRPRDLAMASTTAQPETAIAAPWVRKDMVRAESSRDVVARREKEQASTLAREMRREGQHRERVHFYMSERARAREPIR